MDKDLLKAEIYELKTDATIKMSKYYGNIKMRNEFHHNSGILDTCIIILNKIKELDNE